MNAPGMSDPLLPSIDLGRPGLIEASAGTGKTTLITGIFLRALLEREECTIDRLLVVTFTNAATAELVVRVRELLYDVLAHIERGEPPGEGQEWTADIVVRAKARLGEEGNSSSEADRILGARLKDAIERIGQAQILTIHAFCMKVLSEFALESGSPFERTLVSDSKDDWLAALETVFRSRIEGGSVPFVHYLLGRGLSTIFGPESWTPEAFYEMLRPFESVLARMEAFGGAHESGEGEEDAPLLEAFKRVEDSLRALWRSDRTAVRELLGDGRLNGNRYRKPTLESFPEWMDQELSDPFFLVRRVVDARKAARADNERPPAWSWERWGNRSLNASVKSGREPFEHPFFGLIDKIAELSHEIMGLWETRTASTVRSMIGDIVAALHRRKKTRKIAFHEDLLVDLLKVFKDPVSGPKLVEGLSERYRLVLIDEFQDTDPVQTEIFERWERSGKTPLILVGDPKQSIYRFRGADLNAYVAFRSRFPGDARSLDENFRSSPQLLETINRLFGAHGNPFLTPGIEYVPLKPRGKSRILTSRGAVLPSLRIWGKGAGAETLPNASLRDRLSEETARGIARFLFEGSDIRLDGAPVTPESIAVLVRTNAEGSAVQRELSKLGIPASVESQESVYRTREALGLDWILRAVWDPGDEGKRILALATDQIGWTSEEIDSARGRIRDWERIAVAFSEYRQIWSRNGVHAMFLRLWKDYDLDSTMRGKAGWGRIRTNTWHIMELLNEAEREFRLSPERLIAHFAKERALDKTPGEEESLRPEPGTDQVRILTVHKAKGLGFDIVFCPYLWEPAKTWRAGSPPDLIYRDGPDGGLRVGGEIGDQDRTGLLCSELAERIRLFYVALTRAKVHVTLYWDPGLLGDPKNRYSGAAWIFHGHPYFKDPEAGETEGASLEAYERGLDARAPGELQADFENLLSRLGGDAAWSAFDPKSLESNPVQPNEQSPPVTERADRTISIPKGWEVTSFTRLASVREDVFLDERPGLDEGIDSPFEGGTGLPVGARTGTMLHKILERVDFSDPQSLASEALPVLEAFGFRAEEWVQDVERLLNRVLESPLGGGREFRLKDLPKGQTIREMEFSLPIRRFAPEALWRLLHANGFGLPGESRTSPEWSRRIKGFLNGTVDLVFLRDGRYEIVDYKSNDLGPAREDYRFDRLKLVMEREGYFAQAFLYTVALHRYLSARIRAYEYDRHVGEVYYLFLRGMSPGASEGVYAWRFPEELVLEGERVLGIGTEAPDGRISDQILLRGILQ